MGGKQEMTEHEIKIVKNSTIYELRLLFSLGKKETYTREEILNLLDKVATSKEQE